MPKCVFSLAFRVLGGCFKCHKKEHQRLTSGFNIPADVDLQMHLSVTIAIDQLLYQYPKNITQRLYRCLSDFETYCTHQSITHTFNEILSVEI